MKHTRCKAVAHGQGVGMILALGGLDGFSVLEFRMFAFRISL